MALLSLLFSFLAAVSAQSTFSPTRPPAVPLAVKSPYLQAWLPAGSLVGNGGYLAGEWPTFWNGQILGWTGLIRVDGETYIWMGNPAGDLPTANQTSLQYTATRSIFKQNVNGAVDITVTFLSPITPDDFKRASLISSYLQVEVVSVDGQEHDVQIYTDISAEWVSGDRSAIAQWEYGTSAGTTSGDSAINRRQDESPAGTESSDSYRSFGTKTSYDGWRTAVPHPENGRFSQEPRETSPLPPSSTDTASSPASTTTIAPSPTGGAGGIAYHQIFRQTQLAFSEVSDQTEFGNWYYITADTPSLTHQSGADVDVRAQFISAGNLSNTADTNFRAINNAFPVFGFAQALGSVGTTAVSSLFTINLNQQDAVVFEGASGNQSQPTLWTSYFGSDLEANAFFYNDYATAQGPATDLDNKVAADSKAAAGDNYSLLTELSVRQAFGALQLTGTQDNILVFLKEISSNGNMNTVDVIFPWHPIALYTNPTWLKLILEPLFINQEAGFWPFAFAIHDIGSRYPNATGHNDGNAEQQPLEECGNMIIMSLAYTQRTNDVAWLNSHYDILRQWNSFLIDEALIPADQISTDDFAGSLANQTNLALKGIIGIRAMAAIANLTSHPDDAANFTSIADSYITQWVDLALTRTATPQHTTLSYGNDSSYGLLYNLFAAPLLGLRSFVPEQIYDLQSAFYPTVAGTYGVPLDTRHGYTKLDWEVWVAAAAGVETRDLFLGKIAEFVGGTTTGLPLTDLYEVGSGVYPDGINFISRPVIGGVFALLALPENLG